VRARVQTTIRRCTFCAFRDSTFAGFAICSPYRYEPSSRKACWWGHRALCREIQASPAHKPSDKSDFANGQAAHAVRGHLPWPPRRHTNALSCFQPCEKVPRKLTPHRLLPAPGSSKRAQDRSQGAFRAQFIQYHKC